MNYRSICLASAALGMLVLCSGAPAPADARRGGSFGSRGARTYSAPRAAYPGARPVAPIEQSMTPRNQALPAGAANQGFGQQASRPGGRFGGFGGGMLGGLVAGGLIGHFLGNGMGGGWGSGGGGMLLALLQIAILAGIAWLVVGFVRRRFAGSPVPTRVPHKSGAAAPLAGRPWGGAAPERSEPQGQGGDLLLMPRDREAFEQLLIDLQDAFGKEDYARLRTLTTPEVMSYLSEELGQNAVGGVRNEVSGTRLLDAKVSESWSEASGDYATIILSYESVDVMRDRASGAIVSGSDASPTETTEAWTFIRTGGRPWQVSAIQES
ncbi:TIM44-like domain-containing protein [Sphingomonas sp. BIUV-7]|uniref:TIM44-like domain-containing protein n=1 Tax=Sphingomonas natans TaxID=3063330 RepID=A0ABT8YDB3_9SPHN|nr:TIM44-like domain-containing protein [Sphingomonas sp. BIUV-7]MDO6415605.1 TIM44-like domain-containing protein [Sphingomonas sp. BIUV-7]